MLVPRSPSPETLGRVSLRWLDSWPASNGEASTIDSRSLSGLGARSEPRGRARAVFHDFEAHSGSMQRESREKCTALPTGAVGAAQVRQAPRIGLSPSRVISPAATKRGASSVAMAPTSKALRYVEVMPCSSRLRTEKHSHPDPEDQQQVRPLTTCSVAARRQYVCTLHHRRASKRAGILQTNISAADAAVCPRAVAVCPFSGRT